MSECVCDKKIFDLHLIGALNCGDGSGGAPVPTPVQLQYLRVLDEKPNGTHGGTATVGAWRPRELNTIGGCTIEGAELKNNQVVLPAGTYYCQGNSCFFGTTDFRFAVKTRLYDVMNGAVVGKGTGHRFHIIPITGVTFSVPVSGIFTLAEPTALELQYYCSSTLASYGLGYSCATDNNTQPVPGPEVYADLMFWKLA